MAILFLHLVLVLLFAPPALSTTFLTATTTLLPQPTVTTVQHDFPAFCFDCGPGVDRLDAGTAANAACDYWLNTIMYPPESWDWGGLGYVYGWSGGNIYLSVIPFWNTMGCGSAVTYNNFFVDETRCYYGFMKLIDFCNTNGVNGKQGGYWYDWCANVTINPNPSGCYGSNKDTLGTHEHLLDPGIKVIRHYATDEEHEAARASVRDREKLPTSGAGYASDVESEPDAILETKMSTTPARTIAKRDSSLSCFDDSGDGFCYHCTRDTA